MEESLLNWSLYVSTGCNVLAGIVLYLCLRRLLKMRRQRRRSYTFRSYPIPQVKLNCIDECFSIGQYGPTPDSTVQFIGGEGVEASLTDRETWVVAGLAKVAKRIFEFGTCSGKTAHVMALNAPENALIYTLTIHPSQAGDLAFEKDDDLHHRRRASSEAKFDKFYYEGLSTEHKIKQIFSDSKQFDETGLKKTVDLILIDGAHTKSYVESDSEKAFSMLSDFGVILWHDYKPEAPDVFLYLNNLANKLPLVHIENTDLVMFRNSA